MRADEPFDVVLVRCALVARVSMRARSGASSAGGAKGAREEVLGERAWRRRLRVRTDAYA
jgi:hypothetical protein